MSNKDNNKNNNETINYEELEIGKPYAISLTSGAVISGVLFSKREDLQNGNVIKEYGIMFDSATHVYLCDCQIAKMKEISTDNTDEYFKEIENKYHIKCFNDGGNLLSASKIIGDIISGNKFEELSQTEKKELVEHLYFDNEDILDIVEALIIWKKDNKRLHDDKLKVLDACLEVMDNYNEFQNTYPYIKNIYKLIFKELGIEKFIKKIC